MNRSKKSELRTAAEYGGVRNAGSGNRPDVGRRKDVRKHGHFRIEQKDPFSLVYTVKSEDLDGLWEVATAASEIPIFIIRAPDGVSDVAILDLEDYRQYVDGPCIGRVRMRRQHKLKLDKVAYLDGYIRMSTSTREYALTPIEAVSVMLERRER